MDHASDYFLSPIDSGNPLLWVSGINEEVTRQAALDAHRRSGGQLMAFGRVSGQEAARRFSRQLQSVHNTYLSDTSPLPMITNVVIDSKLSAPTAAGNAQTIISRKRLVAMFPSAQIKDTFGSAMLRFGQPYITDLVWPGLSIVQSGAKNKWAAILATQQLRVLLSMVGVPAGLVHYSVNNCVYKFDLGVPIGLEQLAKENPASFTYYRELFPGAFHLDLLHKTCVLVFLSGKGVAMGPSSETDMITYVRSLYPTILRYTLTKEQYDSIRQQTEKVKSKDQAYQKEKARSEIAAKRKRRKRATTVAANRQRQRHAAADVAATAASKESVTSATAATGTSSAPTVTTTTAAAPTEKKFSKALQTLQTLAVLAGNSSAATAANNKISALISSVLSSTTGAKK